MNNREYLYEMDYLKGLSILGVVIIHVSCGPLNEFPQKDFTNFFSIFFNQLSRFCIPIFLMISPLLFFRRYNPEVFRYPSYLYKRAKDLLIPYSLWTIASIFLLPTVPWITQVTRLNIFETIFLGNGYFFQLYYISVLFQLILIMLPASIFLFKKPLAFKTAVIIVLAINILLLGIYEFIFLKKIPMGATTTYIYEIYTQPTFPIWAGYFMLGCLIGRYYDTFKLKIQQTKLIYFILLIIPSTMYLLWDYSLSLNVFEQLMNPAENFFRISVLIYSICTFLFFFKLALINKNNKLLIFLGRYSFGIYLVHIAVLSIISPPGGKSFMVSNWILTTVTFLLCSGGSILFVFIMQKIPYGWIIAGPLRR
jgi:probable poly-beta-1,6-N-acetyl-D-glucosamine export protein